MVTPTAVVRNNDTVLLYFAAKWVGEACTSFTKVLNKFYDAVVKRDGDSSIAVIFVKPENVKAK